MNQKGFINILLIVIILALVGTGVYVVSTRQTSPPVSIPSPIPSPTPTPTPTPQPSPTPIPKPSSTQTPPVINQKTNSQISNTIVIVISPNGGEVWKLGTIQTIKWSGDPSKEYEIILNRPPCPSCGRPTDIVDTIVDNIIGNSYDWKVGGLKNITQGASTGHYVIRIFQHVYNGKFDDSDAVFTIAK